MIQDLITISQFYGRDSRYVIAGGGNTSYKNAEKIWIKASGSSLATITEEGFAVLDRAKLNQMSDKVYSADAAEREEEVKNDLAAATLSKGKRPSVETSMHNAIRVPASPLVRCRMPTLRPCSAKSATVPPQPSSTSSGWAPIASTSSFMVDLSRFEPDDRQAPGV
jgi:hypothetical protein